MALLLFMTCCDQVGTPRSPRYLRVASDGQVRASKCPRCMRVADDGQGEGP